MTSSCGQPSKIQDESVATKRETAKKTNYEKLFQVNKNQ